MNDWIGELAAAENQRLEQRRLEQAWQMRCDALVNAAAPALFHDLAAQIQRDVLRLSQAFPDSLWEFRIHSDSLLSAANPSSRSQFSAQLSPITRSIDIAVVRAGVADRDRIEFKVMTGDHVVIRMAGSTDAARISELLLKRLL